MYIYSTAASIHYLWWINVFNSIYLFICWICLMLNSPSRVSLSFFFLLPHQFHNNAHMTFGAICLFLFLALVIHPNASAGPNYVTFVLVVRHAHFFLSRFFFFFPVRGPLSLSSLWLWKVFSEGSAAGPQSAYTGRGYARAHWLKWKNKAFGQAAVGREWSSHCSKRTK